MKLFTIFIVLLIVAGSSALADDVGAYVMFSATWIDKKPEKHMHVLTAQNSAEHSYTQTDYNINDEANRCYLSSGSVSGWRRSALYIRNINDFCSGLGIREQIQVHGKTYDSCKLEQRYGDIGNGRVSYWYAKGVPFGVIKDRLVDDSGMTIFEEELIEQGHNKKIPPRCALPI